MTEKERILKSKCEADVDVTDATLLVASALWQVREFIDEFPTEEVWQLFQDNLRRSIPLNGDRVMALITYCRTVEGCPDLGLEEAAELVG